MTGNTAPKLLKSIRDAATYLQKFSDGGQHRHIQGPLSGTCYDIGNQLLDAADKLAALAPHSFELRECEIETVWAGHQYATPQSAPVDGDTRALLIRLRDLLASKPVDCLGTANDGELEWPVRDEVIDSITKALTTPPPASQERGGGTWPELSPQRAFVEGGKWWQFTANGSTAFPSEREQMEIEAERRYGPITPASPPSSAAEGPKVHTEQCDDVNFNLPHGSTAICVCAAEQAKPEPVRDHEAEAWLAAQPKLEQAKPDIVDAVDDPNGECPTCPQSLHVEQAQAGDLPEHLDEIDKILRSHGFHMAASRVRQAAALLRRLAGGVKSLPESGQSIDDAYWQLIYAVASKYPNETRHETALRYILERESASGSGSTDALVAALGAK